MNISGQDVAARSVFENSSIKGGKALATDFTHIVFVGPKDAAVSQTVTHFRRTHVQFHIVFLRTLWFRAGDSLVFVHLLAGNGHTSELIALLFQLKVQFPVRHSQNLFLGRDELGLCDGRSIVHY